MRSLLSLEPSLARFFLSERLGPSVIRGAVREEDYMRYGHFLEPPW